MISEEEFDQLVGDAQTMKKKDLLKMLRCLDDVYFNNPDKVNEVLPDEYYDILRDIFTNRFGKYEHVGLTPAVNKEKVRLPYWLGSMDKLKPENVKELDKWISKNKGPYLLEDKLDGVSGLLIYYPDGKMSLFTRGNGSEGFIIDNLIRYLDIPETHELNIDNIVAIRGEIIMTKKNFKEFGGQYKNARNLVSGVVNAKKVNSKVAMHLDFVTYEIIDPIGLSGKDQLKWLSENGFIVPQHEFVRRKIDTDFLITKLDQFREKSKYEIDGIIINDESKIHTRNTSGNPKYAIAFKKLSNLETTIVEEVVWKASKHGILKPRIRVNPVDICGVTITWVTGFNGKFIEDNKIGPGTELEITRSGDVIPHIVRVISSTYAQMPDRRYKWNKTGVDIILEDDEDADETISSRLTHFFSTLKIRGISKATVAKFVENGLNTITSILDAKIDTFKTLGFGPKVSDNMYKEIRKGISNIDLGTLMAATPFFGFGLGKRKIQLILDEYPNILKSKKSDAVLIKEISEIAGWSEESAKQFVEGIAHFKEFLDENPEISFITKARLAVDDNAQFAGMKIVFSGFRDKKLEEIIVARGGTVSTSVSKNTSLVVTNDPDSDTGKVKKARDLGVRVISREKFDEMIK